MKKTYITPSMEVMSMKVENMLLTGSNVVNISDETTDDDAKMAGEDRGGWNKSWGSIWD